MPRACSGDVGFYILDANCRIIAINRFNRTYCNFSTELDAIRYE